MKTMLELLIRLQQLRRCCERTTDSTQITNGEKNSVRLFKGLVRDCLPADVLKHYDRLKATAPELLECPEVFAMAVLVSSYRSLSPRKRRSLVKHFATAPTAVSPSVGRRHSPSARAVNRRLRRSNANRRRLVISN